MFEIVSWSSSIPAYSHTVNATAYVYEDIDNLYLGSILCLRQQQAALALFSAPIRPSVRCPSIQCRSVITPISRDAIYIRLVDIRISMKLATNVPHVSGHC